MNATTRRHPEDYLHGNVVVVPCRVAGVIDSLLKPDDRTKLRLADPQAYAVLTACRIARLQQGNLGSRTGTMLVSRAEPPPSLGVAAAADLIGISPRAVRKACTTKRLPAQLIGGRWLITPDDAHQYRAHRAA